MTRVFTLLLVLVLGAQAAWAEGTKELQRSRADRPCKIDLINPSLQSRFAHFDAPADQRLQFRIKNPAQERVHIGVGMQWYGSLITDTAKDGSRAKVFMRIKDPNGQIVWGPQRLRQSPGPGFIANFNQAVAGPNTLASGGYDPITFQPTMAGDYYIEFNPQDSLTAIRTPEANTKFLWFDCTVASTVTNQALLGRVWARTWDLSALRGDNQIVTKFYVYTTDSIVSAIDMNGMQPFGFSVRCNRTGLRRNQSFRESRRSDFAPPAQYSEYQIFLNPPDTTEFPVGQIAQLLNPLQLVGCREQGFNISLNVNKETYAEYHIELNGQPGFQPGTEDRPFSEFLVKGLNTIPWDGRDGQGNLLTNGRQFTVEGFLVTGLSNFPIFDAEFNIEGLKMEQVSPRATGPVGVWWDDTKLPGGTANAFACVGACHRWFKALDSTLNNPASRGFGDNRNVNTWWEPFRTQFVSTYTINACQQPINRPPVGVKDVVPVPSCVPVLVSPHTNNYDPDGQIVISTTRLLRGAVLGSVTLDTTRGELRYVPNCDSSNRQDTVIITFCDNGTPRLCSRDTIIFNLLYNVPAPPVGVNDSVYVTRCVPVQADPLANNYVGTINRQIARSQTRFLRLPSIGSATLDPVNGIMTYTPNCRRSNTVDTVVIIFCDNGNPALCSLDTIFYFLQYTEVVPPPPTTKNVFIPEGFSPNGDGSNDNFVILNAEPFNVELSIYNRWGTLVYRKENYKNDWDGTANAGPTAIGTDLPDGTYYYVVDFNNGEKPRTRFITLKR